jgi:PAS domain S-box-containing protein
MSITVTVWMLAGWCAALAALALALHLRRSRDAARAEARALAARLERSADEAWEQREAAERLRGFLDAQDDPILRRDGEGRIVFANEAWAALAGAAPQMLIGTTTTLKVEAATGAHLRPDGSRAHDQLVMTPAGPRWIAWREVDVRDPVTGRTAVQAVGRDVTERAAVEHALEEARDQAQAASRAKSRFLAMMSHEIRTPLSGMLGMADLLLDSPLRPDQLTYVKAVRTSGDALLSLIDEILDLSKIEAGRLDLKTEPFDLYRLVEDMVELLSPRAQAKGIEIAADIGADVAPLRLGDAPRLRQVLLNLAGNAIKFTETGGITIRVTQAVGGGLNVAVIDTGIGISDEARRRIFEEFEQADAGTARRYGGTGLGLAISRLIVQRMGGLISVESAEGAGSTFRFAVDIPAAPDQPAPAATPAATPALAGMRIVVASPGRIEPALIAHRLRGWGAQVTEAAHAEAVMAALAAGADILLADRDIAGAVALPPGITAIVLLTPATRHELGQWQARGFARYLVRPVRAASLAAVLGAPVVPVLTAPGAELVPEALPGGLAVLVAEDDPVNALLARALLTRLGHAVTLVGDGAAAVAAWQAAATGGRGFDLVLMDMRMPGMDGLAAAARIRRMEADAGWSETPVHALTANIGEDDRLACQAAGMNGFLAKPLDREQLARLLEETPARLMASA